MIYRKRREKRAWGSLAQQNTQIRNSSRRRRRARGQKLRTALRSNETRVNYGGERPPFGPGRHDRSVCAEREQLAGSGRWFIFGSVVFVEGEMPDPSVSPFQQHHDDEEECAPVKALFPSASHSHRLPSARF